MRRSLCLVAALALAGCSKPPFAEFTPSPTPEVAFELRLATAEPRDGAAAVLLPDTKQTIYLSPVVEFTNADIERTRVVIRRGEDRSYSMAEVHLSRDAAARMTELTRGHQEEMMAILLDGKVVMAPTIKAVLGDRLTISGSLSHDEVVTLARNLAGQK